MLKPPKGTLLNRGHRLAKCLVGCWLMNEGSGRKILDLSGNGNTGIFYNNTLWTPTKEGCGLSFATGTNDSLSFADTPSQRVNNFTLTLRFYAIQSTISATDRLFQKEYNQAGSVPYVSWGFEWVSNVTVSFFASTVNADPQFNSINVFSDYLYDQWVTLTGTYDGSRLKVYINGILASDKAHPNPGNILYYATGNQIDCFAYNFGASNSFSGKLAYAYLHNRALSASEIAKLYIDPFCMFEEDM